MKKRSNQNWASANIAVISGRGGRIGMKYARLSIEQKREIIQSRKRRGDYSDIARSLGYTPSYVQAIATGKYENKVVVNRLYDKVRSRKVQAEA